MSTRWIGGAALVLVAGLLLGGCDYGVAEWEEPGAYDEEGLENLESWHEALRAEAEELDGERREPITGTSPSTIQAGYMVAPGGAATNPTAPVAHPDPKPWKGK